MYLPQFPILPEPTFSSMNIDRTCRLVTLGCKVNQYETQLVREALLQSGYREAGEGESADVCVEYLHGDEHW